MTDKPTVVEALASVMEEVRAVRKGDRNTQQNYAFRGIDAVMNAAGPAFRKFGVVVVPILEDVHYRDVQTSTGKASRECTVKVRYRFHGPAGDYIECVTPGESMDFGDKGAPKAMSVAYRIALLQALCLPTDDVEPDAQSYERAPRNAHAEPQPELPKDPNVYRAAALSADATRDGLLKLHAAAISAGVLGAEVTDADGAPTTLGDLIVARGKALAPKAA
jgi:hypothetical protein